jgi:hypothetical protein
MTLSLGNRISVAQDRHLRVTSSRVGSGSGNHNADLAPQLGQEKSPGELRDISFQVTTKEESAANTASAAGAPAGSPAWRGCARRLHGRIPADNRAENARGQQSRTRRPTSGFDAWQPFCHANQAEVRHLGKLCNRLTKWAELLQSSLVCLVPSATLPVGIGLIFAACLR